MPQRRFFLLDETCPVSEISNMMCRVVGDKLLPLQKYAPEEPVQPSSESSHNTSDIIPDILPLPSLSVDRKDLLAAVREKAVGTSLTGLFGIDFARSLEERVQLESEEVKAYTLKNPEVYFNRLMENELYARDVKKLLSTTTFGRAYLVTGFLTTKGSIWTYSTNKARSGRFNVTVPVSQVVGGPLPGLVDPEVTGSRATTDTKDRQMQVVEEEIFAVAYSTVKSTHKLERNRMRKAVVVGKAKRAKGRHYAFGPQSDEESDEGDSTNIPDQDDVMFVESSGSDDSSHRAILDLNL